MDVKAMLSRLWYHSEYGGVKIFLTLQEWRAPSYLVTKLSTATQHCPNSHQTSSWKYQITVSIFKSEAVDSVTGSPLTAWNSHYFTKLSIGESGLKRGGAEQLNEGQTGVSGLPLCSQLGGASLNCTTKKLFNKKCFPNTMELKKYW